MKTVPKLWANYLSALPEHIHITETLRSNDKELTRFSAFGVLAELLCGFNKLRFDHDVGGYRYPGDGYQYHIALPIELLEELGITRDHENRILALENRDRATFKQIAEYIHTINPEGDTP